jgi:hypothetical protein
MKDAALAQLGREAARDLAEWVRDYLETPERQALIEDRQPSA